MSAAFITPTPARWQPHRYPGAPPPGSSSEWKYEMRREAQLIIPGLWLGPFQSSWNPRNMKGKGITHVLCVRDRMESAMIYDRYPEHFTYKVLELSDSTDQNLISLIPDCLRFIEDAIEGGGVVLAHCNGGISLSPAIVIAYLMSKYSWPFEKTLSYVQSKRYCVSPTSFQKQLIEYEPIHLAQRMVQEYSRAGGGGTYRSKRELEEDDDINARCKFPAIEDEDANEHAIDFDPDRLSSDIPLYTSVEEEDQFLASIRELQDAFQRHLGIDIQRVANEAMRSKGLGPDAAILIKRRRGAKA